MALKFPGMTLFRGSASTADVAVGAFIGMAGIAGVKFVVNKWLVGKVPALALRALPALSGALTGAVLLTVGKGNAKARGHALGAVLAGVTINVWDEIRAQVPQLADLVSVRLSNYGGMLVDDSQQQYAGMLVDDNSSRNLADLQALNMEADED